MSNQPSQNTIKRKPTNNGNGKKKHNHRPSNPKTREITISKALSKLLRHQAIKQGLKIDSQGFVQLQEVLSNKLLKSNHAKPEEIFQAVSNNDKKRFKIVLRSQTPNQTENKEATTYDPEKLPNYYICALQGHSIKTVTDSYDLVELPLDKPEMWPLEIIHGTSYANWELIKKSGGLSKMRRNHVHFAAGLPYFLVKRRQTGWFEKKSHGEGGDNGLGNGNAHDESKRCKDGNGIRSDEKNDDFEEREKVISGMRKSSQVLIYLDVTKLLNQKEEEKQCDGTREQFLRFYKSGNGVILTPGDENGIVRLEWVLKVTDAAGNPIS
ncbi:unnamed protein product [Ambrosiozyma monospora]|uniref:2'-phosphotransferase n=1 Tax=Ambrosiozyma monospora TaxID=43982 RepID=A0A9W6YV33_AMBMO|nr:unnamed protein product [Ambrosiozyma monospora]